LLFYSPAKGHDTEPIMNTNIAAFSPDLPVHMTFEEHDWHLLAQYWYPIALARDITDQPTSSMLLDMPLVIYKMNDELVVAKDACPHRGVPLSLGKNDGQGVVCRYHGLRFGNEGKCNRIPAHPQHKISERFHLKSSVLPAFQTNICRWIRCTNMVHVQASGGFIRSSRNVVCR
jgi:nitrite reductase/ring-hydroxylating ferredoxin subunit